MVTSRFRQHLGHPIYFDPSWRAVAESVDVDADGGFGEEKADTIWGLTYIDEAIVSRRIGGGSDIGKGDPIYHLYDAQFSVVARMRDEGGVLPRMVERIRYSVYGEPTVFPYSFADCADTSSGDGPDGYITTHDQTQFNAWYGATPKDIRADVADDGSVVPMDLGSNTGVYDNLGLGDQNAFNGEYGANGGLFPVEGASSFVPGFWSSGGATGATGPTDSPVSDVGYCGYAWNPGSGQYAVRFRNYDPGLGRWLQRDPILLADGMNLQEYCHQSPVAFVDPRGMQLRLPGGRVVPDLEPVPSPRVRPSILAPSPQTAPASPSAPAPPSRMQAPSGCCIITVILHVPPMTGGGLREHLHGHAGMGIDDEFFDWGPEDGGLDGPRLFSLPFDGVAGAPWWYRLYGHHTTNDVLADYKRLGEKDGLIVVSIVANPEECAQAKTCWKSLFDAYDASKKDPDNNLPPRYNTKQQCASATDKCLPDSILGPDDAMDKNLPAEQIPNPFGGKPIRIKPQDLVTPRSLMGAAQAGKFKNTCGPGSGKPADVKVLK